MADIRGAPHLRELKLSKNPIASSFFLDTTSSERAENMPSLLQLDLSDGFIPQMDFNSLSIFPKLRVLNLTNSGLKTVVGAGLRPLSHLQKLLLTGCPVTTFPTMIFQGLKGLTLIHADSYRLCCSAVLPQDFDPRNCHAPSDSISSCDNLLSSTAYRVALCVLAVLAVLGNLASFTFRAVGSVRKRTRLGFDALVLHLCVSDFLMGLYLSVVGVADLVFRNSYLGKEEIWRTSRFCSLAGFLSLLSSEVSAFIICLITLDRFLVLRFPFSQIRLRWRSGHATCGVIWLVGASLSAVPLFPATSHWRFYSQTGICIPLPTSQLRGFAGQGYSFGIMIVLNFILFVLIAAGQLFIYLTVRAHTMSRLETEDNDNSTNKNNNNRPQSHDMAIARRLLTVVITDFLCWFPVGLLGLMSMQGTQIPAEVNVAVAVLVMPLNSALNPFLYTLNMVLEKRQLAQEQRLRQYLVSQLKAQQMRASENKQN